MNRSNRIYFDTQKLPGGWHWLMATRKQGTLAFSIEKFNSREECEEQIEWIIDNTHEAEIK